MKCHAHLGGIRRLPRHRAARTLSNHMSRHNSILSETLCVASLGHIKGWSASRARVPLLSQQNTSLPTLAINHSAVSTRPLHSSSLGSSLTYQCQPAQWESRGHAVALVVAAARCDRNVADAISGSLHQPARPHPLSHSQQVLACCSQ
jgi:hypothetical protein